MGRVFTVIASLAALMVVLAGGVSHWFSSLKVDTAKEAAAMTVAASLAGALSQQLEALQQSVDGVAQLPQVLQAFAGQSPQQLEQTANDLQTAIPFNLRLRLLLPNVNTLDQAHNPPMSFGDLDMVRASLVAKQKPVIQGEAGQRHLAFTSAVRDGDKVVGVVLASLNANIPQNFLAKIPYTGGKLTLRQEQLTLASVGDLADDEQDIEPQSISIPNSRWTIDVQVQVKSDIADTGLSFAIICLPALLACLGFFMGYRKLSDSLRQDQSSILKAAKDMMQGKIAGNYPMQLPEMQPIITAIAQFKRVLDQEQAVAGKSPVFVEDEDFFDESFDMDFLEPIGEKPQSLQTPEVLTSVPISMPDLTIPLPVTQAKEEPVIGGQGMDVVESFLPPDQFEQLAKSVTPRTAETTVTENISPSNDRYANYFRFGRVVGQHFPTDLSFAIGQAFASEAKAHNVNTVVLARDSRETSPALAEELTKGLLSTGCDVLDIGMVPTPILAFVGHHTDGRSAVMVSGGNLPAAYNGLKMILSGEPGSQKLTERLQARMRSGDFSRGVSGSVEKNGLFINEYIGIISEDIHIVRPMTVVLNAGSDVVGQIAPLLLRTIGCDVIELGDGRIFDPAEPAAFEALSKAVVLNKADVGLAFGGDGDTLVAAVDSAGEIRWPDALLMLFAADVLAVKPGSAVVLDSACSRHLAHYITRKGGQPVLSGEGLPGFFSAVKQHGAALAGDFAGHFVFNDRWLNFSDALYAAVRLVEILSSDSRVSTELFTALPHGVATPEWQISVTPGTLEPLLAAMRSTGTADGSLVDADGVRVEFADGWWCLRPGLLDSVLGLRFEADSAAALSRIQTLFKQQLLNIRPDISLPF